MSLPQIGKQNWMQLKADVLRHLSAAADKAVSTESQTLALAITKDLMLAQIKFLNLVEIAEDEKRALESKIGRSDRDGTETN